MDITTCTRRYEVVAGNEPGHHFVYDLDSGHGLGYVSETDAGFVADPSNITHDPRAFSTKSAAARYVVRASEREPLFATA